MKKLMFAAAGVAVAGGAFASPLVYDYQASAKHMYAKEINVKYNGNTLKVYQKYVKAASLKGYLIVDAEGATSQSIIADKITNDPAYATYANSVKATGQDGTLNTADFGRNRAFLVVQNTKAEKEVRFPKLIPAVLDAKWLDTKFKTEGVNAVRTKNGLAEGYLYAGGDFSKKAGANLRPNLERFYDLLLADGTYTSAEAVTPNPNVSMICDYAWQSLWLFGSKNMPLIANAALAGGFWDIAQAAIDANLVLPNNFVANKPFFHDSWLNGAGFGKYVVAGGDYEYCCGYSDSDVALVLQSLSGNLKGGLFICTENGTILSGGNYSHLASEDWEDQFFCARIAPANTWSPDRDQTDLWQDGELELNTTDCISGSWSIKLTTKKIAQAASVAELKALGATWLGTSYDEDAPGLTELVATIKGAAYALNSGAMFANGREINKYSAKELASFTKVPLMTPSFAAYYGLLNFK